MNYHLPIYVLHTTPLGAANARRQHSRTGKLARQAIWLSCWLVLPVYLNSQINKEMPQNAVIASSKIDLLNDSLSYWYKWIGVPHYTVQGLPAGTPTGDGFHGVPLGINDPTGVFTMITMDGEPALKISGEIYGGLTTKAVYENYHLRLEYKWGQKQWLPRQLKTRGGGVLFHLTGTNEDAYWSAFMMGLEFQIAEGSTGDMLFMANKDSTQIPEVVARVGRNRAWDENAPLSRISVTVQDVKFHRSENYESDLGNWTTLDLYTIGSSGIYLVNGHVVMAFQNAGVSQPDNPVKALMRGKIQIESEGSELYCRHITIETISDIPSAIKKKAGLTSLANHK